MRWYDRRAVLPVALLLALTAPSGKAIAESHGPDLSVAMLRPGRDARGVVVPGGTVTVSVGVNNLRGDADAHSCVLSVILPDGLKLIQARPAPNRTEAGKGATNLSWNLGTLMAGAFPHIFELDLTTTNVKPDTQLTISAKVTTSDNDVNQENNTSAFLLQVVPTVAALALESSLDSIALSIGAPVKFTVEVSNWGSEVASGSALTLTLPAKVSFQSGDPAPTSTTPTTVTWQLGDIGPTDSREIAISITLDPSLATQIGNGAPEVPLKFTFDASTTAPTAQINPPSNHLEVDKRVELAGFDLQTWLGLEGTEPGRLPVGKDVTYAITYGNFGNTAASKAAVSLNLGDGLSFVSADPSPTRSGKSDRFGGGVLTWDVGDLNVGQSDLIKCRVHVTSVPYYGSLVMSNIAAAGTDINPANNSAVFYGYPPASAEAHAALNNSPGNRQKGLFAIIWPWLLTIALVAGIWLILRKIRRPDTSR